MIKRYIAAWAATFTAMTLAACSSTGVPENITPVSGFDADRYLGTWYEAARLDHRFERGLDNVTANYSLREDGSLRVLNKGYNTKKTEWETAEGKAYFVGAETSGHLKVSFFGPFYGSYVVFDLDEDYTRSYVSGPDKSYLWLLTRSPVISDAEKAAFITKAAALGYDTEALIWVDQSKNAAE